MTDSVDTNAACIHSSYFSFLINPNGPNKSRYIGIVSNMLEFHAKGIFSTNQARADSHFYNNKPRKLGGTQILVTTDRREICMSISYGLAYLPVRCPTNEDMESCTKVLLIPSVQLKPLDLDSDGQWEDSDEDMSFGANVSATNFTQFNDVLEYILSDLQHKSPTIKFTDDMALTKGTTNDKLLYGILELDTCKFEY